MVAGLEHPSDLNVIVICEKICLCIFKSMLVCKIVAISMPTACRHVCH